MVAAAAAASKGCVVRGFVPRECGNEICRISYVTLFITVCMESSVLGSTD